MNDYAAAAAKKGRKKPLKMCRETQNQRLFKVNMFNNSIHVYYTILTLASQQKKGLKTLEKCGF